MSTTNERPMIEHGGHALTITTIQIQALRREAAEAGDLAQVSVCDRALGGDEAAIASCAEVIAEAQVQADDEDCRAPDPY